jgi:hypothetical protein
MKIDSIFHFVWLGGEMPPLARANIDRVRELYPESEVKVWTTIPGNLYPEYSSIIHHLDQLCMKSDLIRMWAVNEYGGTYLDTDVYLIRRFDHLMPRPSMYFWNTMSNSGRIANCIFGDTAGGESITKLVGGSLTLIENRSKARRTSFGPTLFASLAKHTEVLPCHYIAPYLSFDSCRRFVDSEGNRESMLDGISHRFSDGVRPFALHFGGIPSDQMPVGIGRSSFAKRLPRGDALLSKLPTHDIIGAEIGVFDGVMSSYLLGLRENLRLIMVDSWASPPEGDSYFKSGDKKATLPQGEFDKAMMRAVDRVKFAGSRTTIVKQSSVVFSEFIADRSLDFIFIDANHSYEAVMNDIGAWSRKVKIGGLLSGHDFSLSERNSWGVASAVRQWCSANSLNFELGDGDTWFVYNSK